MQTIASFIQLKDLLLALNQADSHRSEVWWFVRIVNSFHSESTEGGMRASKTRQERANDVNHAHRDGIVQTGPHTRAVCFPPSIELNLSLHLGSNHLESWTQDPTFSFLLARTSRSKIQFFMDELWKLIRRSISIVYPFQVWCQMVEWSTNKGIPDNYQNDASWQPSHALKCPSYLYQGQIYDAIGLPTW